jgi:hypothetical protein
VEQPRKNKFPGAGIPCSTGQTILARQAFAVKGVAGAKAPDGVRELRQFCSNLQARCRALFAIAGGF